MAASSNVFNSTMLFIGLIYVIRLAVPVGLLCILEYFLAKRENPWPGKILIIVSALCSGSMFLLLLFNVTYMVSADRTILLLAVALVLCVVPTVLFYIIYRMARKQFIEKEGIKKMNVQDLE